MPRKIRPLANIVWLTCFAQCFCAATVNAAPPADANAQQSHSAQVTRCEAPEIVLQTGFGYTVDAAKFSNNGKYVVTGSVDKATLWDSRTGTLIREFPVEKRVAESVEGGMVVVNSVAFSPDDRTIVGTEWPSDSVVEWDIRSGAVSGAA